MAMIRSLCALGHAFLTLNHVIRLSVHETSISQLSPSCFVVSFETGKVYTTIFSLLPPFLGLNECVYLEQYLVYSILCVFLCA